MLKKLRIQFICTMMTIVTVLLGIILGMVFHFASQTMENQSIRMLQSLASGPVNFDPPTEDAPNDVFPFFSVQLTRRGEIIAAGGIGMRIRQEQIPEITRLALETGETYGTLEAYALRFMITRSPGGQAIMFADISAELESQQSLKLTCIAAGAGGFFCFFLLSLLLSRWMVRPVEKAWNDQRQFIADASHELKTPLTVIMTNAELLQEKQQDPCSGSILTMSRQMRRLVEGLLELARVDNGAVKLSFTELNLTEIAENAALSFEALFFEQGLTLNTDIAPGIGLKGSAQHLRQVVDILLDNALKYTAPSGEVTLTLKRQGNHALLSVASPGQEISAGDLKKIFQRFYRIDEARSRTGSYGLGLSIAQSITEDHGGNIWAESREGINTFFVQLPIS